MLPPLTLLRSVGTGQAHFAVSGVGEIFLHQLRHFGSTLLDADEDRRTTSLRLDAVGKLAACFGQEGGGEGYDLQGVEGFEGQLRMAATRTGLGGVAYLIRR